MYKTDEYPSHSLSLLTPHFMTVAIVGNCQYHETNSLEMRKSFFEEVFEASNRVFVLIIILYFSLLTNILPGSFFLWICYTLLQSLLVSRVARSNIFCVGHCGPTFPLRPSLCISHRLTSFNFVLILFYHLSFGLPLGSLPQLIISFS